MLGFVRATRRCLGAGGCPAAAHFILLAQNTSKQTKGHPPAPALRASLGFPKRSGGCGTRATRSDSRSRRPPIFSENRGGAEGDLGFVGEARVFCSFPFKGKARMGMVCAFGPLGPPPSSAAKPGDFCEDCLSAQREFRSSPAWRATQGTRSVAKGGG